MRLKSFVFLIGFLFSIGFAGCSSSVSFRNKAALSKAVSATRKALAVGRVDLAKEYNLQAARLLPSPTKESEIAPVEIEGKRYVVLPIEFDGSETVALGSSAWDTLIKQEKPLQRQLAAEKAALGKLEKETNKVIAAKEALVEKAEANALVSRHSFWGKIQFYGKLLVALVVLAAGFFFIPVLLPLFVSAGRAMVDALNLFLSRFIK